MGGVRSSTDAASHTNDTTCFINRLHKVNEFNEESIKK